MCRLLEEKTGEKAPNSAVFSHCANLLQTYGLAYNDSWEIHLAA
jgi:hypothetical protein